MQLYWRKNLYFGLLTAFVGTACFNLVIPFLPYVLTSMEVSENLATWSGLAYAASSLTSAFMAPVWGSIADKYGNRFQILRSGIGIAITYALYPVAKTPLQFVLLRGLTGFMSGYTPAATSLISANTPEDQLGYALGMLQAANAAGTISGPLLGGAMVSTLGIPFTFKLSALLLIAISVVAYVTLKEEVVPGEKEIHVLSDIRACLANRKLLTVLICIFLMQAAIQITQPTLVLYVDKISQDQGKTSSMLSGIVYSFAGLGTVLGSTLMAKQDRRFSNESTLSDSQDSAVTDTPLTDTLLADTPSADTPLADTALANSSLSSSSFRKRRPTFPQLSSTQWFIIGLLGSAISVALQGAWLSIAALSLFRMAFGFFNGMVVVSGNILTAQSVSRDFRSRAFGVLNSVLPLGSVTGPLIGGALGDSVGLGSSFLASAGMFCLSAGVFILLEKRSGRPQSRKNLGS